LAKSGLLACKYIGLYVSAGTALISYTGGHTISHYD
jgi:hypothetical protein